MKVTVLRREPYTCRLHKGLGSNIIRDAYVRGSEAGEVASSRTSTSHRVLAEVGNHRGTGAPRPTVRTL